MTLQERALAVFRGERPDVVPWYADITYWYHAQERRGALPEKYRGDGLVQLYRDLNAGAHEHLLDEPWDTTYEDVEEIIRFDKDADGFEFREHREWRTPVGNIHQTREYIYNSFTWAYRDYPVKTPQDLEALRFIYDHQTVTPNTTRQERQIELFGDAGLASSIAPRSPMAQLFVIWMGVMNASYALADAPESIEQTLEALDRADDSVYEIMKQAPAPLVYFPDNITGEVVSPRIYKKYYAPYHTKRAAQLHEAGKFIFLHIDGTIRNVLPHVGSTGVDCAQSLTVAPIGDAEVSELRSLAGPDVIMWTGVPGAYFSPIYPWADVEKVVMDCLRCYRDDSKFMMCVCDQVPPDGEIDRVRRIADLIEEHGRIS